MTQMRFIKFIEKVLDHTKTRTVRKKRKCNCGASIKNYGKAAGIAPFKREECICQIKKGDMLQVYALIKVGEAPVTNVQKLVIADFTDEDAQKDGFEDCYDFEEGLQELHGDELYSEEFRIIDFDPQWKPQKIVNLSLEDFATRMTKEQWIEFMKEDRDQPREWPPKTDKDIYLKHKKGFD